MRHAYFWLNVAGGLWLAIEGRTIESAIFIATASIIGALNSTHAALQKGSE